jgi:ketosteroid isomerase-like protein
VSEESVELVKRLLEMFASRDHEAVFAFYDPDIEWDASNFGGESASGVWTDLQGIYHGHEGVRMYWRRWLQAWADLEFEVGDVLDAGDDVVALIRNQRQWGGVVASRPTCRPMDWCSRSATVRWSAGAPFRMSALRSKRPG